MRFLKPAELKSILPTVWGAASEDEAVVIRQAITDHPDYMRRIHDLAELTQESVPLKEFLSTPIGGKTPLVYLCEGEPGVQRLDMMLVDTFRAGAPREIFDLPGKPTDIALKAHILMGLMWERETEGPGGHWQIHDPLKFEKNVVRDIVGRLAAAISAHLERDDSLSGRGLFQIALRDSEPQIRLAALRAGKWMIGYPEILEAIGALRGDPERLIRQEVIKILSVHADTLEVAQELAKFRHDPDVGIRRAAIASFLGRNLPVGTTSLLIDFACDADPDVSRMAKLVVPIDELTHFLRGIIREMEAGFGIEMGYLTTLARSDSLPDEEKEEAFLKLLAELTNYGESGISSIDEMLRSLSFWKGDHSEKFWTTLSLNEFVVGRSELRQAVDALIRRTAESSDAWTLIHTLLETEKAEPRPSVFVANLLQFVAPKGRYIPEFVDGLMDTARDRSYSPGMREAVIWSLNLAGPSQRIAGDLKPIFMSTEVEPSVAKQALMTAYKVLGQDEREALFREAMSSPVSVVSTYASSALETGIGQSFAEPKYTDAEGKVVDLAQARKRRKSGITSKTLR